MPTKKKEGFLKAFWQVLKGLLGKIIPQNIYNSFVLYALLQKPISIDVALFFLVLGCAKQKFFLQLKTIIMNSGSKVLLGVLAGAATGAILGVLFAPDKGEETRKRISEGSRDVTDNLKTKFGEFVDGLADKYESVRDSATDLIDQGKQKATNVVNALKSDASNLANTASQATGAAAGGAAGAAAGARAGAETGSGLNQL